MKNPYINALKIPFDLLADLFVKNETVSGIIGKVQGIISATNPPRNPRKKIPHKLLELFSSAPVPPQVREGSVRLMALRLSEAGN